ncbi:MAG: UDP-N-acetylmuramate dehydrogenase [Alphaproteobacteria bacterium]
MRLLDYLPKVQGTYRENASLSKTNWFNVGGPAEILYKPKDAEDLAFFLKNKPRNITYIVIGCGSNLIVRDKGIEGVVIKLTREFTSCIADKDLITVGAGCLSYNLAMFAMNNSIGGIEFLSGIPGTIGGNLAMNAGAYGGDISSILQTAILLDDQGNFHELTSNDIGYFYRGNNLPKNWIFTACKLKGYIEDYNIIKVKIDDISIKREQTQPVRTKTSGSTFKNPIEGKKAWQLIDEAGCRGLKIGGAIVSEKHCNFFINENNATAKDLEILGEEVRKRVKEKTGVELEWEIKIIGKG